MTTTAAETRPATGAPRARARGAGASGPAVFALIALFCGSGHAEGPAKSAAPGLGDLVVRADMETSVYADSDHVSVVTPTLGASVESPLAGWSAGGRYLIDVVTAASVDVVATATRPFREARHVISADGAYKRGDLGGAVSASASIEPDYVSAGGGGSLSRELHHKQVTLQIGYGYSRDTAGRAGTPFEVFRRPLDRHSMSASVSWIADRSTIAAVVGDVVVEDGDPSKPYRYVPMFEPGAGSLVPAGAAIGFVDSFRAHERPLEQLPLSRGRFALTGRVAHRSSGATVRIAERLYTDTWGLVASTTDLRLILDVTPRLAAATHARAHVQSGAFFWRRAYELEIGKGGRWTPPALRAGDRELGPMYTITSGFAADIDLSRTPGARAWALRLTAEGMFTHFLDALYISRRVGVFAAVDLAATFD